MPEAKLNIRKVVVLGAGTMGAQVAAHLVAQGLEVTLLDVVPAGATDRSVLARKGAETLRKLKPSPLHLPEHAARLRPGNFDDDLARELPDADWVFEAVVEDYIRRPLTKAMLLIANALLCIALGAVAIFAILSVNFGA